MKFTISIFITILFYSCANMMMPTGGAKDTTPPILLSVSEKQTKSAHEIHFVFNENIQFNNWENNFYISPPLNKKSGKKINGKTLILSINDSLVNNTTYLLSLSNCIKDLNEGNIIDSLSLIFGSANYFDTLTLSGNVQDAYTLESIKNAWVMLFDKNKNDTIIFKGTPNYIAKTDKDGNFSFPNLNSNKYTLVVLTDLDFIYSIEEKIAFSSSLINAKKDSFITLFAFDPITQDSTKVDTFAIETNSPEADTLKDKQLPTGSLIINVKQSPSIIFQLLQNEKISYSFSFTNLPFLLTKITPGKYKLKCILDENRDGEWTTGNWETKIQAEKVFNYSTEITIRSNWDLELDWNLE